MSSCGQGVYFTVDLKKCAKKTKERPMIFAAVRMGRLGARLRESISHRRFIHVDLHRLQSRSIHKVLSLCDTQILCLFLLLQLCLYRFGLSSPTFLHPESEAISDKIRVQAGVILRQTGCSPLWKTQSGYRRVSLRKETVLRRFSVFRPCGLYEYLNGWDTKQPQLNVQTVL